MNDFPPMFRLRQRFPHPRVEELEAAVRGQLDSLALERRVAPGQSVAVTVGSRGIAQLPRLVQIIVKYLSGLRLEPFVVPAMGSHGGATAEGQRRLLADYGVTEAACGCPVRSSMETQVVCHAPGDIPVHIDRLALEADHVLVFNRVKPHTDFAGKYQSGLMKMMLIGLGKHAGARAYHGAILDRGFDAIARCVAAEVIARCGILAGLAVVENAAGEIARVEALAPAAIVDREPELLALARQWTGRLPFTTADLLIVDEIGKDVSGSGMDTNVIGRKFNDHAAAEDEWPKIRRIFVRGLTPATRGNATGIGMAEFCTTRLVEATDRQATAINCITSNHVTAAMLPIHFATDQEAVAAALATIGWTPPESAKVMWIRNTAELEEVRCSQAYFDEALRRDDLEPFDRPRPIAFDAAGNLCQNGERQA